MASSHPTKACDECGAEMDTIEVWSTKSPPLIGKTIEYAEYACPECGAEALLQRKESNGDWRRA